jgi:putative transposase
MALEQIPSGRIGKPEVQLCVVHMIRGSLRFVSWKDHKAVVADLKGIYQATTEESARENLACFAGKWDSKYPTISKSWQANWQRVIPFFAYPDEIRMILYTTNAIESLNSALKKNYQKQSLFPD